MKTKRRVEITMETRETTIIHFRHGQITVYCAECRRNTSHLSVSWATTALSLSPDAILRLTDGKQIHASKADDGALLLCCDSLGGQSTEQQFSKGETQ